jgi:hypothetical protein
MTSQRFWVMSEKTANLAPLGLGEMSQLGCFSSFCPIGAL